MMSAIGHQPILWVNVRSLLTSGPYAEPNMRQWNAALLKACRKYPNMRIYDWASDVKDPWFISDGIHFTTEGYAARGKLIANALSGAFSSQQDADLVGSSDCRVDAGSNTADPPDTTVPDGTLAMTTQG
jgi:hypothetical protein